MCSHPPGLTWHSRGTRQKRRAPYFYVSFKKMKNIIIILILLFQSACASTPNKYGELSYAELSSSVVEINISEPSEVVTKNKEILYSNLLRGIKNGWPDLKVHKNTETEPPLYCLNIDVLRYNVNLNISKTTETVSKEKKYYKIYETRTALGFKYELINLKTGKSTWSKEVNTIVIEENKVKDICGSSSILTGIVCEIVIEPIFDSVVDLILSPFITPHEPYKLPTSYEEMFFKAGEDISKSLPNPRCSTDGYSTCLTHYFRNF